MPFCFLQAAEEDLSGLVHQRKCYAPRETPKTTEEIIASYAKYHEKQIQRLKCPITEDTAMAGDLLLLIYDMGTPEEAAHMIWQIVNAPEYFTGQVVTMDGGWI